MPKRPSLKTDTIVAICIATLAAITVTSLIFKFYINKPSSMTNKQHNTHHLSSPFNKSKTVSQTRMEVR